MCNSNIPKREEVIINQNGIGTSNSATTEQLQYHISAISTVMMVMLGLLLILGAYLVYKCYRKCHHNWIENQIIRQGLRRSFSRTRAIPAVRENNCTSCGVPARAAEEFQMKTTV